MSWDGFDNEDTSSEDLKTLSGCLNEFGRVFMSMGTIQFKVDAGRWLPAWRKIIDNDLDHTFCFRWQGNKMSFLVQRWT
jgi:hypothetical protein